MAQRIIFSDEARADIRAIDRETAMRVLHGLARLVATEAGDIKQLQGYDPPRFRLRVGDYRILYRRLGDGDLQIIRVLHRGEAYR